MKPVLNGNTKASDSMQQELDNISNNGYSGKLSVRIPKSLHKQLIDFAKAENISLNQYILYKLSK